MTTTTVKERPILRKGPEVRAILRGATQLRRIVKPLCHSDEVKVILRNECVWVSLSDEQIDADNPNNTVYGAPVYYAPDSTAYGEIRVGMGPKGEGNPCRCPYGKPGDRLWVCEKWAFQREGIFFAADQTQVSFDFFTTRRDMLAMVGALDLAIPKPYKKPPDKWRPSIHMPRWASRILLELTDVRVQRLQEISEEDAIAEGIERVSQLGILRAAGWKDYSGKTPGFMDPIKSFRSLWESINGPGSWDANPWVWAMTFKRIAT